MCPFLRKKCPSKIVTSESFCRSGVPDYTKKHFDKKYLPTLRSAQTSVASVEYSVESKQASTASPVVACE